MRCFQIDNALFIKTIDAHIGYDRAGAAIFIGRSLPDLFLGFPLLLAVCFEIPAPPAGRRRVIVPFQETSFFLKNDISRPMGHGADIGVAAGTGEAVGRLIVVADGGDIDAAVFVDGCAAEESQGHKPLLEVIPEGIHQTAQNGAHIGRSLVPYGHGNVQGFSIADT